MKMRCIPGQNDHSSGWIGFQFSVIEFVSEPNIKDAGYNGVDAILRVLVRHQLHTPRDLNSDGVGSGLQRLTDKNF